MYRLPATCLPVEVRLIITAQDRVLLVPTRSAGTSAAVAPEPARLRLPTDVLGLGEPASEAVVRVAADQAALAVDEGDLDLTHVTHHRVYGEEQLALFFHVPAWDELPRTRHGAPPGHAGQDAPRWYSLHDLPEELGDLDRDVLDHWRNGRAYSEAGWCRPRPSLTGGLSPLQDALRLG